jgi:hypothetical protein
LQGPEGFLLDLDGLNRHWIEESDSHFIIALRGKIKGKHNACCHLLMCVPVTGTGLRIRDSVKWLLELKAAQGLTDGPALSKENSHLFSSRAVDDSMLEVLEDLFISNQDLFPTKIETSQDLQKSYQVFRILRRTLDTWALEMRVSKDDINVMNWWAGVKKAQGRQPRREMQHYYADVTLLLKPFKRYTSAMWWPGRKKFTCWFPQGQISPWFRLAVFRFRETNITFGILVTTTLAHSLSLELSIGQHQQGGDYSHLWDGLAVANGRLLNQRETTFFCSDVRPYRCHGRLGVF